MVSAEEKREEKRLERRIRERFVKAFATYSLLQDGDHVLVGLSGGKDSLCLLEMLGRRAKIHHPQFTVEAIHVRMADVDYLTSTDYLERFCQEFDVPLHIVTTSFDHPSPPTPNSKLLTQNSKLLTPNSKGKPACFLCSWNRRKQMFNLAQQLGCNKIALGHHRDDLLITALMNLFYQSRFETMPASLQMNKMPLQIIRPLCLVDEADISRYAELRGYERQVKLCPYEDNTQRNAMHRLLDSITAMNTETRHSLWNALLREGKIH